MAIDKFGDYLISIGKVQKTDVLQALEIQADSTVKVGTICLEEGFMTIRQVMDTLRNQADTERPFEDLAITLGYLTAQQLGHAYKIQSQRRPFFGEILVNIGAIERGELFEQLGAFWTQANEVEDDGESNEKQFDHTVVEVPFPLMYPEELEEFTEDVSHSLQKMALELTNIRPGADFIPAAQHVAFLTNKIKGAAELDGVKWLADVAGAMEQGMLMVCDAPENPSLTKLMHVYFRAADAIQAFLDSIQGNRAMADQDTRDELIDRINAYGTIEDMVTQEKVFETLGQERVSKRRTGGKLEGRHILLIDDDTVIRNSLERYLRSNKLKVDQAKNGALALEHVIRSQDEFDLIIVDLHMPIMDGFEFVTELKQFPAYNDIPIIMFTASLHMADVRKATALGIEGYVIKREWKTALLAEMKRIMEIDEADETQAPA
ncbi:MAG: response regulator [Myxococcota bacterium]|nr:response regulator [Myxococcota bacterium]